MMALTKTQTRTEEKRCMPAYCPSWNIKQRLKSWVLPGTENFHPYPQFTPKTQFASSSLAESRLKKENVYILWEHFIFSAWKNPQNNHPEELMVYRACFIWSVFTFESISETVVGRKTSSFTVLLLMKWWNVE